MLQHRDMHSLQLALLGAAAAASAAAAAAAAGPGTTDRHHSAGVAAAGAGTGSSPLPGSAPACPVAHGTQVSTLAGYSYNGTGVSTDYIVCEDFTGGGGNSSLLYVAASGATIALPKRVVPQTVADKDSYLGLGKAAVMKATHDVLGAALLAKVGGFHLADVEAAVPPMRTIAGPWTWTATRESAVDIALTPGGDDKGSMGLPTPAKIQFTPLFNETPVAKMEIRGRTFDMWDGLVGGHLPVLVFFFPDSNVSASSKYWEMTIAPVPFGGGNEAPVHIRYVRVEHGDVQKSRYFNNFAQNCESTSINTSEPSSQYYANLLDQHHFWLDVFDEGAQIDLPKRNDTDGAMLVDQMKHARVRDMITRNQGVWPRYGESPGYGGTANNGFQEVFTASMMAALEHGQFSYAEEVLVNYLRYYVLPSGGVFYRGLEMAQSARILTNIAQYYEYTQDAKPLIKYLPKIKAVFGLLMKRRAAALELPSIDRAFGCLTGDDEADLYGTAIDPKYKTEMAFMSITAEAWRGFRDLGRAMTALGAVESHVESASFGADLVGNATDLWTTFRTAMKRNAVPSPDGAPACLPYVFGTRGNSTCGELPTAAPHGVPITVLAPSERDSESWRTYSEAFYSGAMLQDEVAEILAWHKVNPTESGSSLVRTQAIRRH